MAFHLLVPRVVHEAMIAQAIAEAPNECCGLLAGVVENGVGRVAQRYPLVNAAASPVLFESDFHSIKAAYKDIDDRQLAILAVYHSHPTSHPVPSKTDLERNLSEDIATLIVSLACDPPLVRAWWLTATAYREADWEVI